MNTVQKGRMGEKIACNYLIERDYKIVKQNYYTRHGEVDIIAWDKKENELVFVEVKARASEKYGYPEEAVDESKIEKISMAAESYLTKVGYNKDYRFDCIAIEFDYQRKKAKIRHFKNIG